MKPGIAAVLFVSLSLVISVARAQTPDSVPSNAIGRPGLSDSEVLAAIDLGRSTKRPFGYFNMTAPLFGVSFEIMAQGPFGRIVRIVVATNRKEVRFRVKAKDREKLR